MAANVKARLKKLEKLFPKTDGFIIQYFDEDGKLINEVRPEIEADRYFTIKVQFVDPYSQNKKEN